MNQVWYMKQDYFRNGIMGFDFCQKNGVLPNPNNLAATHVLLTNTDESNVESIYRHFQAEEWSPNGEARDLIASKGLSHTSMCVGDVAVVGGSAFMVDNFGFKTLHEGGILDGFSADQIVESLLEARPTMTYDMAMAAAKDEGMRNMRANGRDSWDEDDYNVMVQTFDKLFPEGDNGGPDIDFNAPIFRGRGN